MKDIFGPLPVGLTVGIMVLGVLIVLVACMPTAWVDKVVRMLQKPPQKKP